jgi:hypothetical protein
VTWFEVKRPQGTQEPRWKFCAAINDKNTVFAPAAIAGNEQAIFLCDSFDGVPAVISKHHVYLPTAWLVKEYPDMAEVFYSIERRCLGEIERSKKKPVPI